jgi:acetyltransferase-like isoleucine patch superfamily enzyme
MPESSRGDVRIHPTALVSADAHIEPGVSIGAYSIIEPDVRIGADSIIGPHCLLGESTPGVCEKPLIIGPGSLVRSHSVLYVGSDFGGGITTGHHVTIRERTTAGADFRVGTLSDLQGDSSFGNYVRCHSNVHVGKGSSVGSYVWLFPYVVLTNDPHPPSSVRRGCRIGDWAVVATGSVVLPGVVVGPESLVAAQSLVRSDVPSGHIVGGVPAKFIAEAQSVMLQDGSGRSAYPWREHFRTGYPDSIFDSSA